MKDLRPKEPHPEHREDVHPAACPHCCKKISDEDRRMPEFIAEFAHYTREFVLLSCYSILALLFAPALLIAWLFGQPKKRGGVEERVDDEDVPVVYYRAGNLLVTPSEEHLLADQARELKATHHAFKWAPPKEKEAKRQELQTKQYIHKKYADELKVKSDFRQGLLSQYETLLDEINDILRRDDAGVADWVEVKRLEELIDRALDVRHKCGMVQFFPDKDVPRANGRQRNSSAPPPSNENSSRHHEKEQR